MMKDVRPPPERKERRTVPDLFFTFSFTTGEEKFLRRNPCILRLGISAEPGVETRYSYLRFASGDVSGHVTSLG